MKILNESVRYKKQVKQIVVISILFCIGISIGTALALSSSDLNYNIWLSIQEETISGLDEIQWQYYFGYLFLEKGKWYGLLLLFSVTVVALPYIAGTIIYKGISIGFFFTSLHMGFGWKGIIFALAAFFPQIIIFAPVTVVYLLFLLQLYRDVKEYRNFLEWKQYIKYGGLFILCLVLGCLLQAKVNLLIIQSAAVLLR